jgi:HD-like signal output (HDOD) protein/CheY-like chemotaxis protein
LGSIQEAVELVKKRILFVDDDQAILRAMKNLLRKECHRWDLVFAEDGQTALDEVRRQHIDVVVTDMRMPVMDGADLLTLIRQESPTTARIMLTGSAEPEAIARALPALHQLLVKPCDRAKLQATIERSLDATSSGSHTAIGSIDRLPSPARTVSALGLLLDNPAATASEVAAVVSSDPAMAAKVLQLASSEFFASVGTVTSIASAVEIMGLDRLRQLRLASQMFELVGAEAVSPWLETLQTRSLAGAISARLAVTDPALADRLYAAALLRYVGRAMLAMEDPAYREALVLGLSERALEELELERFGGITQAELGAWLLGLWGLPLAITELVRYQARPQLAPVELRAHVEILQRCCES